MSPLAVRGSRAVPPDLAASVLVAAVSDPPAVECWECRGPRGASAGTGTGWLGS